MKLKKLFKDLKNCRPYRDGDHIELSLRFWIDTEDYYFAFIPTVLYMPWPYRQPDSDGVIDIWWLNIHLLLGRWVRGDNKNKKEVN
jgi:hypothetical protein